MLHLKIQFSHPAGYENRFVSLSAREHCVEFTLADGDGVARIGPVELGTFAAFQGRPLLGEFRFDYHFDATSRTLTWHAADHQSRGSMRLRSWPEGSDEVCTQYAFDGGFPEDDLRAHPHWNYQTLRTPGLDTLFKSLVRAVHDRVTQALREVGDLIIRVRRPVPPMSLDEQRDLLFAYRNGVLRHLDAQGDALDPEDEVFGVESILGGTATFPWNSAIANVIGSTDDPKIASSWIKLWRDECNRGHNPHQCTSETPGFCDGKYLGGHIISGNVARRMPKGSDDVYILPICINHNNNDRQPMATLTYLEAVWLKHYMQKS